MLDQHPDRWPIAWIGLAIAAGLATAVSWTETRSHPAAVPPPPGPVRPLWPIALAYLLFATGYLAYITFLSAFLADRHASPTQTALTWTLLGLAVVAAPSLWQRPIARWPDSRVLAALLAVLTAAATLALLNPTPTGMIVSALAYGATVMAVPAAVTALVRTATPTTRLTGTLAAFTVVFATGQTAGPWLAGILADHTGPAATLGWTATLCGAAAVLAVTTTALAPSQSSS